MRMGFRILGVLLAVALVTGGMVAGWYGWQNQQGNRLWNQTRRELEAGGEVLSIRSFIPPAIPDDQNLAFAPLFVRLYQYKVDPKTGLMTFNTEGNTHAKETTETIPYGKGGAFPAPTTSARNWITGYFLDLARWQQYYRRRADFPHAPQPGSPAAEVRFALTRFGPLLDELARAAAERPLGRFPVNWTQQPAAGISLPQDNLVQKFASLLRLRATASLALGDTDAARRDICLGLRLDRATESEPSMIANLVDVTCLSLLLQPVWEGLANHQWSAAQLAALQAELGQIDVIRDFKQSLRAERAFFMIPLADELERKRNLGQVLSIMQVINEKDDFPRWMSPMLRVFPEGWFAEDKAVTCRLDQRDVIGPVLAEVHRIDARASDKGAAEIHRLPILGSTFVAKLCLPVGTSIAVEIACGQAMTDEAGVACALDRYFLEHRSYPERLDALVPVLLDRVPTDVIDGEPMRYQRTPEGSYRLWEVGWNGVDEGGKVVLVPGTEKSDVKRGDWVWQYGAVPRRPTGEP